MWRRIFTTLSLAGSATIFLLSIGSSPVPLQFFASTMWAMNRDCYHQNIHLSKELLFVFSHSIPFLTTTEFAIRVGSRVRLGQGSRIEEERGWRLEADALEERSDTPG